jgi:hypothetical protein
MEKRAVTETRSTSAARVKAHRARKSRGVYLAQIELPEAQVDRLTHEGYLDGNNTVPQAIEGVIPFLEAGGPKQCLRGRPEIAKNFLGGTTGG